MNQYVRRNAINTLGNPMVDPEEAFDAVRLLYSAGLSIGEALRVFIAEVPDHGMAFSDLACIVERLANTSRNHVALGPRRAA